MKKTYRIALLVLLLFGGAAAGKALMGWRGAGEPHLTVYGPVNMCDGIGRQSVELIQALKEELKIDFVPTQPIDLADVPSDVVPLLRRAGKAPSKVALLEDVVWLPSHPSYKKFLKTTSDRQIRIAYSMFESTKIPDEWVILFNRYFDAVAVPDRFLVDVYRQSGVEIPVFELPLALRLDPYLQEPLHVAPVDRPFVFGNLGACVDRKNQLTLIRAFARAFGASRDVLLRINCRGGDKSLIRAVRQEIENLGLKNVQFTQLPLSAACYLDLFKSIDCYVSLSKGEGFSIQPREAMALGIPVIATDNTAQSSLCASGLVRRVASSRPESASYSWGMRYGEQYNCSLHEVEQALRDVYEHYTDYLERSPEARLWSAQYNYPELKARYLSLFSPKKVVLGEENRVTEECLITTSPTLRQKYLAL